MKSEIKTCLYAFFCLLTSAFCLVAATSAVLAQSMAEVAAYAGPDRQKRLVEGAKKEGSLTLYTSATTGDMGAIVAGFEAKYGIKVNIWRSSSEAILQRAVNEARAKRHEVDAFE